MTRSAAHVEALEAALRTWTGTAYADLGDHPDVLADRAALDELRATAQEDTALGLLALGEHAAVLAATEQAGGRHPLRERTRSLQALALVRTGRQVEALEVLRGYRELLVRRARARPRAGGARPRGGRAAAVAGASAWLRPRGTSASRPPRRPRCPRARTRPACRPIGPPPRTAAPPGRPPTSWAMVGREAERAVVTDVLRRRRWARPGRCSWSATRAPARPASSTTRSPRQPTSAWSLPSGAARRTTAPPRCGPGTPCSTGSGIDRPAELERTDDGSARSGPERAFEVQDALARAVRDRARDQPVLLVVEDLHWADTRTLRALTHLVTTLRAGDRVALRRHPSGPAAAHRCARRPRGGPGPARRPHHRARRPRGRRRPGPGRAR